jgi:myo-inositol-hexaphosphate 3-phosphohydrolase
MPRNAKFPGWRHMTAAQRYNARKDAIFDTARRLGAFDSVLRYVATYVNAAGERTLMSAAQGRNTYANAADAQSWIDAVTANNSADNVAQIWGENPQFEVRACLCWPNHFDPKTVWFD